jgi:hypothetical protein
MAPRYGASLSMLFTELPRLPRERRGGDAPTAVGPLD